MLNNNEVFLLKKETKQKNYYIGNYVEIMSFISIKDSIFSSYLCNAINEMNFVVRRWWVLIIACVLDVEAGWLLVMSQRFTSVLS